MNFFMKHTTDKHEKVFSQMFRITFSNLSSVPEVVKQGLGESSRLDFVKEANILGGFSKEWCLSSGDSSENIPCKVCNAKRLHL